MSKKWLGLIILLMASLSVASYVLLRGNRGFSIADETRLGKPLAVVREIHKDVRFKNPGDFFWQESEEGQKLYNGSEVFVGAKSKATVFFSGNRRAKLSADTLLRISQDVADQNSLVLALSDGAFNLKNFPNDKTGLVLKVDEAGLKIGPGFRFDLYVKKRDDGLGLAMASGKMGMAGVTEKTELLQGESIIIKERSSDLGSTANVPEGNQKKVELYIDETLDASVKLLHPVDNQIVYNSGRPQLFQWSGGSQEKMILQYSTHPDFFEKVVDADVTGLSVFAIPTKELHGDVFWRLVSYYKGVPQYSKAGFFKITNIDGVSFDKVTLQYLSRAKWQLEADVQEKAALRYEYQVSQQTDFNELFDAYLGKPPFRSMIDSHGDFFIRVRRIYDNGLVSGWSEIKTVRVREPLKNPVLQLASQSENKEGLVTAHLTWEQIPETAEYLLQFSRSPEFTSQQSLSIKDKLETDVSHSQSAPIYYRLVAQSQEGEISPPSNIVAVRASELQKEKNQALLAHRMAEEEKLKEKNSKFSVTSPADKSVFYVQQKIKFTWDGPGAETLQLSTVPKFTQDIEEYPVQGKNSLELTRTKTEKLYWRLNNKKKSFNLPGRMFTVLPQTDTLIESIDLHFIGRGKWEIFPQVKGARAAETYQVQLSHDAGFTKIYRDQTQSLNKGIEITEHGEYFVRAKKISEGKAISAWSNTVTQFIRPPLSAPILGKNEEQLISPEVIQVKLAWETVQNASSYLVEIADTEKFGSIQRSIIVRENNYSVEHSTKEPSYLRVSARSQEGELSPASKVFKIKGLVPGPAIDRYEVVFANYDDPKDTDKLHVLWSHRKNAKKYIIEVGRKEDLRDAQKFETVNIEFFRPVKEEGWYYFRLRPISGSTEFFDTPSSVYAIEYRKLKELNVATLDAPQKGQIVKAEGAKPNVRFAWGQVLGAAWYELELARDTDFKNGVLYKVEARDYLLRSGIDKGRWYFRVRGRSQTQSSPWSPPSFFELR
ncbi:hypothetical protein [Bdellovibrio sp. HCB-110]|uniref:hypothetical protein n=1 Tax=Bdellovibrio sp. HCB-110 TaxID=3391182 RepID=UPI0039B47402